MKTRLLVVLLSQLLIAFVPRDAAAQSQPTVVPVPETTLVPVTTDSYPLGAADHLNVPEDLSKVGYVEEEYFVSGLANVYEWSPPGAATVRTSNAPYTTRMLVRRPARKDQLSGNVIVEILNATNLVDLEIGWALSRDYFVRNGDVWIGFTSKPVTALALQKFNPTRYAPISWANPLPTSNPENCTVLPSDSSQKTENGLIWDIFSQIAAWARTYEPIQPSGRTLRVYGYGYSQSGFDLNTYVSAVFPLAKQANGKPIFDGFLIATSFNTRAPINQCVSSPFGSAPAQIQNAGVPIIRMASNSEPVLPFVRAGRRSDSDTPGDQFREYEIAGAAHASQSELYSGPNYLDILAAGAPMPPLTAGFGPRSPLNIGIFQDAGFANLDKWVRYNVPPPPGALISFNGNTPVVDQFGNSTGGVRSAYLDVPTAQWFYGSPGTGLAFLIGYYRPFDAQHLRPLYPSHEDYVEKVVDDTRTLVSQRYILGEDGDEIIRHAQKSDVPTLADIPSDIPETLRAPSEEGQGRE